MFSFLFVVLHSTECLVWNPLFYEPEVECDMCMKVKDILIMTPEEAIKKRKRYLGSAKPVLIRVTY